jgi:hypothetical protein
MNFHKDKNSILMAKIEKKNSLERSRNKYKITQNDFNVISEMSMEKDYNFNSLIFQKSDDNLYVFKTEMKNSVITENDEYKLISPVNKIKSSCELKRRYITGGTTFRSKSTAPISPSKVFEIKASRVEKQIKVEKEKTTKKMMDKKKLNQRTISLNLTLNKPATFIKDRCLKNKTGELPNFQKNKYNNEKLISKKNLSTITINNVRQTQIKNKINNMKNDNPVLNIINNKTNKIRPNLCKVDLSIKFQKHDFLSKYSRITNNHKSNLLNKICKLDDIK